MVISPYGHLKLYQLNSNTDASNSVFTCKYKREAKIYIPKLSKSRVPNI